MKIKILLVYALLFLFSTTYAQELQLQNIDLNFCNDGITSTELDLTAKAGETIPICINFINASSQDTTINVDFLDSIITQDNDKLRACNGGDRPKQYFGNFMLDYQNLVTISGNSSIQKIYKIQLPVGFKGLSHGCVAYNQVQQNSDDGAMINIVVRKVNFVDIFVGDTQIKSQIKIGSIKTIKSGNIVNFQIGLKNIGNVKQKITFSGFISNIFGFKKNLNFDQDSIKIDANEEILVQTDNQDISLPVYKGLFNIKFNINNKPYFDFNIKENDSIPENIILGGNFNISKIIFISNPYIIGIVIIFLILIYMAFFKKRKKQVINIPITNTPITNN